MLGGSTVLIAFGAVFGAMGLVVLFLLLTSGGGSDTTQAAAPVAQPPERGLEEALVVARLPVSDAGLVTARTILSLDGMLVEPRELARPSRRATLQLLLTCARVTVPVLALRNPDDPQPGMTLLVECDHLEQLEAQLIEARDSGRARFVEALAELCCGSGAETAEEVERVLSGAPATSLAGEVASLLEPLLEQAAGCLEARQCLLLRYRGELLEGSPRDEADAAAREGLRGRPVAELRDHLRARLSPAPDEEPSPGDAAAPVMLRGGLEQVVTSLELALPEATLAVTREEAQAWGLTDKELLRVGLEQVRERYPLGEGRAEGEVCIFEGTPYAASHALMWDEHPDKEGPGGVAFGVPDRDALVCAPLSGDEQADRARIQAVQRAVQEELLAAARPVSAWTYVRGADRSMRGLPPPEDEPLEESSETDG